MKKYIILIILFSYSVCLAVPGSPPANSITTGPVNENASIEFPLANQVADENGNWRIAVDGNGNLVVQGRLNGAWVTKKTYDVPENFSKSAVDAFQIGDVGVGQTGVWEVAATDAFQIAEAIQRSTALAAWLGDIDTTVTDSAFGSYPLTVSGGLTSTATNALIDNCLDFDGTDGYAYHSTLWDTAPSALTISGWIRVEADTTGYLVQKVNQNGPAYHSIGVYYDADNNRIRVIKWNGTSIALVSANDSISLNTWYHVVVSAGAGGFSLHLNNSSVDSDADTNTFDNGTDLEFLVGAGDAGAGPTNFLNGKIDQLRIYDYQISATMRTALYNSGSGS